jgi:purine catabolism regulator
MTRTVDLATIPVHFISVIEMPVDNFIRANEIVLTTALGCHEDETVFLDFVQEIFASKASAMVITMKSNSYVLPAAIIEFGNNHHFPIIMLPWEYRFAEIIEVVLEKINNEHLSVIDFYENVQKDLLSMYLSRKDLNQAANLLGNQLACAITITDEKNNVKGTSVQEVAPIEDVQSYRDWEHDLVITIQANGRLYGHLMLFDFRGQRDLRSEKHYIEKYTIMPLTLWFNKEDIINVTTLKLKNDYVWNLINHDFSNNEEQRFMGKKLGFDIQRPYTCIVCKIMPKQPMPANVKIFEEEIAANIYSIESLMINVSEKHGCKIMSTIVEDHVAIYYENTESDHEKSVYRYIHLLENALKNLYPNYQFYWGMSEIQHPEVDFRQIYLNANLALHTCLHSDTDKNIGTFEDSTIFKILTLVSDHVEIFNLSNKALAPLMNHSRELIHTLNVFIQNNYNLSQTARALHLHRQSLLYRMKKIEELIGLDLEDHNNLFLLEIYTRMHSKY